MTAPWSRPRSVWPLGVAAFLAAGLVAGGLGVATSVLSPGLGLDLLSLWPGLIPAVVAAVVVAFRRAWGRRFGALPSLLAVSWLALGVAAHLDGWPPLPSSAAELSGPPTIDATVALAVRLEGELAVSASEGADLYRVAFIRQGGEVGIPQAAETTTGESLAVELSDGGATPWHRYAGWRLTLSSQPKWDLRLAGEPLEADLTGFHLLSLVAEGGGWLSLPSPEGGVEARLSGGAYEVVVTPSTPVVITGAATVPATWQPIEGGYRSPGGDDGWVISVAPGATVLIIEA